MSNKFDKLNFDYYTLLRGYRFYLETDLKWEKYKIDNYVEFVKIEDFMKLKNLVGFLKYKNCIDIYKYNANKLLLDKIEDDIKKNYLLGNMPFFEAIEYIICRLGECVFTLNAWTAKFSIYDWESYGYPEYEEILNTDTCICLKEDSLVAVGISPDPNSKINYLYKYWKRNNFILEYKYNIKVDFNSNTGYF